MMNNSPAIEIGKPAHGREGRTHGERELYPSASLDICVMGKFRNEVFFAIGREINPSGMLFESEKFLAQSDIIRCSFVLQRKIAVAGEIVKMIRKRPGVYHYGVRFIDLDPNSKAQIEQLVKTR
jgi:hypothetical protein